MMLSSLRFGFLLLILSLLAGCREKLPRDNPVDQAPLSVPDSVEQVIRELKTTADSLRQAKDLDNHLRILQQINETYLPFRQWDSLQVTAREAYLHAFYRRQPAAGKDFAREWYERMDGAPDTVRGRVLEYVAYLAKRNDDKQESLEAYRTVASIWEQYPVSVELVRAYSMQGILYSFQGDYFRTEQLYRAGIRAAVEIGDTLNLGKFYLNLGRNYETLEQPEKAFTWYEKLQALDPNTDGTYQYAVGRAHHLAGRPKRALAYVDTALYLQRTTVEEDRQSFANMYKLRGNALLALGQTTAAIEAHQQSVARSQIEYPPGHREIGKAYYHLGHAWKEAGNEVAAFQHYELAYRNFLPAFSPNSYKELPPRELLLPEPWIMEILRDKGRIFEDRFQATGRIDDLQLAARHYGHAVWFIQQIKLYFAEAGAKAFYGNYSLPFIEDAVRAYEQLYQQTEVVTFRDTAFQLAQEANAFLLRERLQEEDALLRGGVPMDTIGRLLAGRREVRKLKEQLNTPVNPEVRDSLAETLFSKTRQLQALEERLPQDYPAYAELRYDLPPVPVAELQAHMSGDELVIKFFYGIDSVYAFGIRSDQLSVVTLPADEVLQDAVRTYRRSISDMDYIREQSAVAESEFLRTSRYLYEQLFAPLLRELDPDRTGNTLHIVPDGPLGHLVFDCLLQRDADSWLDNKAFLLSDYGLVYHYAAGLVYADRRTTLSGGGFLGFGLEYEEDLSEQLDLPVRDSVQVDDLQEVLRTKKLGPLRFADDEVLAVSDGLLRQVFLNEKATKSQFLRSCGDYAFIHLAAHGYLDDDPNAPSAFLVFESEEPGADPLLSLGEVYGLNLQAEMVVLSACQTGDGFSLASEGVLSLARGFQLAGSNTVLASQWSITDQTSMQIMELFYDGLRAGKTKAQALREAKLTYLTDDALSSPAFRSPAFWSAYMLVGANDPVDLPVRSSFRFWWLVAAALILVFAGILRGRRR